jgi:hypothetical protein
MRKFHSLIISGAIYTESLFMVNVSLKYIQKLQFVQKTILLFALKTFDKYR